MVSLAVVVGPPARAGFQGVSVVMMAWSWRSRLQAMATRAWFGLIGSQRTADFVGLRCFCFVLLVFEGDLGGCLVADPGVNTGPIVEDFDIFGNEPAGLLPGG